MPSHPAVDPLAFGGWDSRILILFLAAGVAPFVEEIMFRGYGFQMLLGVWGPFTTVFTVAAVFAALHARNPDSNWLALTNTAGFGALFGHLGEKGIDKAFQEQVRDYVKPGTSALFMVIEQATPDKAIASLQQYGGTVIRASLSDEDTQRLQEALNPEASGAAS